MSKFEDKLFQLDQPIKKKKNHLFLILIIIIILILGILLVLNGKKITNKLGITKDDKQKETEKIEENLDADKTYDSDSGLIVPKFYDKLPVMDITSGIKFLGTSIEANSKGYTIKFKVYHDTHITPSYLTIDGIYIDGYDTDKSIKTFSFTNEDTEISFDFTIDKTKLDLLGINDFNNVMFLVKIESIDSNERSQLRYTTIEIPTKQVAKINNDKDEKIRIDESSSIKYYYYKTEEDKENYYIYFIFDENSEKSDPSYHEISIKKLLVNNKVYDAKLSLSLKGLSKSIKYITIPKKEISKIDQLSISFAAKTYNYLENKMTGIYFTTQRDINIKKAS